MTSVPLEFPTYRAPAAESDDGERSVESLGNLLGRVSKNTTGEINGLIGDFERLREKLQTDGDRIRHEIEEHRTLSELVMQLTKTISESVEKVRASINEQRTDA
jgi:methyl-accepting chemotaxis protein